MLHMLERGLWALYAIDSDRGGLGISALILLFDVVGGWMTAMTVGASGSDNEAEDSFDLLRDMHSASNHRSKVSKKM